MADCSYEESAAAEGGKRQQFGSRFLRDPARVFHHNAWDNVEWSEEQAAAAERKVQENSAQRVCQEKQEDYELNAHKYWDDFYKIHENGFFKDRHWLFTEFPELAPDQNTCRPSEAPECAGSEAAPALTAAAQHTGSVGSFGPGTELPPGVDEAAQQLSLLHIGAHEFPGSSATYRILEGKELRMIGLSLWGKVLDDNKTWDFLFNAIKKVGCGVGNTVFPILQTNNDPGLFVYCCDFSSRAVELVRTHPEYDPSRCFAFVHDLCDEGQHYPVPEASLDVVVLIFVLSAIVPDKMQQAIGRLARLLRPGGMMLLRDYGRYDMAQLRFKKGQCLSGNFYVRGDGTRVYFFTQDELDALFTAAGLEKVQNLVDRRLQVNRGKQLMMYRVWIQCKYRKPVLSQPS